MTTLLSATSSGSFLVSSVKVTSKYDIAGPVLKQQPPLPALDWSLCWRAPQQIECLSQTAEAVIEENQLLRESLQHAQRHITARDDIIEGAQAQLIVQDLWANKLHQSLFAKENMKTKDRNKIIFEGGKGQHLTHQQLIAQLEEYDTAREAKAQAKEKRRTDRSRRKVAKEVAEAEWRQIKAGHQEVVRLW